MVKEKPNGKMALIIMEVGKTIYSKDKVSTSGLMEDYTVANGKIT